ncbi:MAG TPA: DnaJ domain-containing protein [Ktedonobacteraceae bacterium]|nr:DnaJ domain-containing protein [Ktedonobacteraceae bacterium]
MQDYYAILGVTPGAAPQDIKRAYHRLARLHHPDLNQQAKDDLIKLLNEAYAVLRDPTKRAAYDEQRAIERARQAQARREPQMTWFEGMVGFVDELKKGLKE